MGKKDLEIWEEKKRASAKEDGLKSAGPPRRFPCNVCKNLADFLLSVYLAGHITLRKISSMAMAAGIVFLVHALCAFHKALVIFIKPLPPPAQWIYCTSFHSQLRKILKAFAWVKALGRGHYQHLGCAQLHLAWALTPPVTPLSWSLELGALCLAMVIQKTLK